MFAAVVLAACLEVPLFDLNGPVCPPDRTATACGCSEGLTWDAPVDGGPVDYYEVRRRTVSSGNVVACGTTTGRAWYVAHDPSFPHAGVAYDYEVRACNAAACGAWSDPVRYVGAPYACYEDGREVACYVGDDVVSR